MAAIHLTEKEDGVLLVAAKAGDQITIPAERLSQAREVSFYAVWSKDAIGGAFVIETAHHPGFPGAWQDLGDLSWVKSDSVQQRAISGVYLAVRLRMTEDVVNGTVTIYGIAN